MQNVLAHCDKATENTGWHFFLDATLNYRAIFYFPDYFFMCREAWFLVRGFGGLGSPAGHMFCYPVKQHARVRWVL